MIRRLPVRLCRAAALMGLLTAAPGCGECGDEPAAAVEPAAKPVETPLKLKLVRTFDSGLDGLKGIAIDAKDQVYLAGAAGVRVLGPAGKLLRSWGTSGPARCVAVDAEGSVYVGLEARVEKFDKQGKPLGSWGKEGRGRGEFLVVTAIALHGSRVYVADAGNRCVHCFDFTGDFIDEIGKHDPEARSEGLICPSPYLDCAAASDGTLFVTNPGMRRIEHYKRDGKLLGFWGKAGTKPHQFTGCCNPTNLALLSDGRVATAEKVIPRLKVYGREGTMLAYVGPELFSRKAAGLDLAVDSRGRLYVIDPGDGKVRVFELTPLPRAPRPAGG